VISDLGSVVRATFSSFKYTAIANKQTATTPNTALISIQNVATARSLVAANTNTTGQARISGLLRVNGGGTVIPQVSLGIAAAAVVGVNAYFRIVPVGSNTVLSVGNWS
jgi:hypothetical protein